MFSPSSPQGPAGLKGGEGPQGPPGPVVSIYLCEIKVPLGKMVSVLSILNFSYLFFYEILCLIWLV